MKHIIHVTFLSLLLSGLNGLDGSPVCASTEPDVKLLAPLSQTKEAPSKDTPSGGTDVRKDVRENEEPSNRLDVLKLERDLLQSKADDLQRQLETVQQDLASGKKMLVDLNARATALEKEKGQISTALTEARDQARDLATKLAAEQVKSATLREDKQRLMSGTTTAKEEIARLQKRAGELETEAARAEDLNKRLIERDQEIERLRKITADRESLANKVGGLTDKLERTKQRVATLTEELAARSEEVARARKEREQLLEARRQQDANKEDPATAPQGTSGRTDPFVSTEQDKSRRDQMRSDATSPDERRASEESAKASPNGQEAKGAKESPSLRLATAQTVWAKSLDPDIAKGDLNVQNGRDRLTITMADRALFEPGQEQIKPEGLKLLKRISDMLKTLPDKQLRLEGHSSDQSVSLSKDKVLGTWELSMARTTRIVQHLLEEGAVDSSNLSIGIFHDDRPVAGNGPEEGRSATRWLEIILSPKTDR